MTETLLTLGAMSVMSVAIYAVLKPADASAQVKIEQDNLRSLSSSIDRSMGVLGSFEGLTTAEVLDDDLAPRRMRAGGGLRTAWGAPIVLSSNRVNVDHDSFVVSYPNTPATVCASLASAMSRDTHDIRVGGGTVFADGSLDPGLAAQRCSAGNATMDFIFHSGLVSGQAVAAAPVVLPPPPPTIAPPPGSPPIITIPGTPEVDPVTPGTPAVPPPAAPPPVLPPSVAPPGSPPPPVVPPPTFNPPPPPVTPPGVVCSPPASWVDYDNRTPNCAVNQYGVRTQRRNQAVSYTCPEAWGNPVEARAAWSAWTDTANNCTACPTLAAEVETQWLTSTGTCPAGQSGTVSHEYEQRRSRSRSYNCPAGTTTTLPPISSGNWGGWSNTGSTRNSVNTCENNCVVPNPATETQTMTNLQEEPRACPAGQIGQIHVRRQVTEQRSRTASCPAPTGSYVWSGWSGWTVTNVTGWVEFQNTCAAACAAPSPVTQTQPGTSQVQAGPPATRAGTPETQAGPPATRAGTPATQTLSCPAGQVGAITQTRTTTQTRPTQQTRTTTQTRPTQQTRTTTQTRTVSYTCPSPTGSPVSTTGPWSAPGAPYGTWSAPVETGSWSASGAPYGAWSAPVQTGSWSASGAPYGAWTTTSNTCKPSGPPLGSWVMVASNWGYGAGPAYDYWSWSTYANGSGWCGNGGDRPPQGAQSCGSRPSWDSCHVGDSMSYEQNEGYGGGVEGYELYTCE